MCRWLAIRNRSEFSRESASSKILRTSMSILPMTAPAASISSSEGTSAGRGSSIRVCSRSVSFAANPGRATAAARTASASRRHGDRLPGPNSLQCCVIALAGANPQDAKNVRDEYLPVADLSGLRCPDDGLHDLVDQFVLHRHFDAGLRYEIDHVFRTAIEFRMAALPAEALDLGHRHAGHPNFGERGADVVQFEGFDDGSDQFHSRLRFRRWSCQSYYFSTQPARPCARQGLLLRWRVTPRKQVHDLYDPHHRRRPGGRAGHRHLAARGLRGPDRPGERGARTPVPAAAAVQEIPGRRARSRPAAVPASVVLRRAPHRTEAGDPGDPPRTGRPPGRPVEWGGSRI